MPAKTKTLTKEARQKKIDTAISTLTALIPGGAIAAVVSKATKALVAKEQEALRWKVGQKSKPVDLKKGGSVKKRTKSGGVLKVRK